MDTKALRKITCGLYVVGSRLDGRDAGCVVDAVIQSTSSPAPSLILCSNTGNQTNAAIRQTGAFTLSVLGEETDPFVIANFGFQSGRDAEKWKNVPAETMGGLPVLQSAGARILCAVREWKELSTHTVFFCDVTDAETLAGTPVSYADYQARIRPLAMAAFQAFKNNGAT